MMDFNTYFENLKRTNPSISYTEAWQKYREYSSGSTPDAPSSITTPEKLTPTEMS